MREAATVDSLGDMAWAAAAKQSARMVRAERRQQDARRKIAALRDVQAKTSPLDPIHHRAKLLADRYGAVMQAWGCVAAADAALAWKWLHHARQVMAALKAMEARR